MSVKKAQTSMFVVVGAILIIIFGLLFLNAQFDIFVSNETKLKNQVQETIERCIEDSAVTGVFLLGFQGGYIDIPLEKELDFRKHLDLGFKVPNWDSVAGDIPTVDSMQLELENFVRNDSLGCIQSNLAALDFLNIETKGDYNLNAEINKESIVVEASYPVTFSDTNSQEVVSLDNYVVKFNSIRLGDMFDLATEVYNVEASTNFMEELVLDQIYSSSDYRDPNSMPSEGITFSCARRVWTIPQLQRNLANLNNNNFKYLYFDGTASIENVFEANLNEELGTENLRDYFDSNYVIQLQDTRNSYENYRVEVFMPSTEITGTDSFIQRYPYREFEVTPSNGQIVKSIDMKVPGSKIPIPCVQLFHHLYTLDYDLMVKITDENEDGEGFFFQYPLRVDIKNNNPKVRTALPISTTPNTATSDAFCSDDAKQYPVRIFAIDENQNTLSGVNISYQCISLTCDIGATNRPTYLGYDRPYADSVLETEFPFCIGGIVSAEKEGYHAKSIRIDTEASLLDRSQIAQHDIEMIRLKEFKVGLETFLIVDENGLGSRIRDESDGGVYITIENKEYDFESSVIWPTEPGILDTMSFLDKDDITYNLSVIYVDEDYDLKGIFDLENWEPQIHSGNFMYVTIPTTNVEITEENFIEFYEETIQLVELSDQYGINFN